MEHYLKDNYEKVYSRLLRSTVEDFIFAWETCFKIPTRRKPHFHSWKNVNSFPLYDCSTKIINNQLKLSLPRGLKIDKKISFAEDLSYFNSIELPIYSISRRNGKYYISLTFKIDKEVYNKQETNGEVIGLDFGLMNLFTDSNNKTYNLPQSLIRQSKRIKRLQQILSTKQKGSKNQDKLKSKLNDAWLRYNNIKKDYIEKMTYELCSNNCVIGLEDLDIQQMVNKGHRTRRRNIYNHSFHQFKIRLQQKSERFKNCNVILVDRYYPSSQLCSSCGARHLEMKDFQNQKDFICECGLNISRDYNAALNILKEAERLFLCKPVG